MPWLAFKVDMQYFSLTTYNVPYDTIYQTGINQLITVPPGTVVRLDGAEEALMVTLCDPVDNVIYDGTNCIAITTPNDCTKTPINGIYCTGTGATAQALTCKQFYHLGKINFSIKYI